jgi:hypothetical protein
MLRIEILFKGFENIEEKEKWGDRGELNPGPRISTKKNY